MTIKATTLRPRVRPIPRKTVSRLVVWTNNLSNYCKWWEGLNEANSHTWNPNAGTVRGSCWHAACTGTSLSVVNNIKRVWKDSCDLSILIACPHAVHARQRYLVLSNTSVYPTACPLPVLRLCLRGKFFAGCFAIRQFLWPRTTYTDTVWRIQNADARSACLS